jgi:thioredoxin-like negative regulator of GroEL
VKSIPNMILFENGKPTVQTIGAQPKVGLERALGLAA